MRQILIGGAWPYANGSLHIGHIAGLLPGDVLARYHRAIGDKVYFVSGSDCHGTPVAIRAKQENKTPQEVSDFYHSEFVECFERLGFSYDAYTKTSANEHKDFVRDFHKKLYESPYVYEKEVPQAYCENCNSFLADRFVLGKCPKCGSDTRGDQCDSCGTVLEPETLIEPKCAVCGKKIGFKNSTHLYIAISKLQSELETLVENHPEWRKNAIAFTNRYINDGLRDRALTRDLEWGISVPKEGYENKTIYIWAENVLGYSFTEPYYYRDNCIVVKKGGAYEGVKGLSELAGTGCKVTTQLGTGWIPLLDQIEGAETGANYETTSECFMAISNGVADVCIVDLPTAQSAALTNDDLVIIKLDADDTFSGDDEMVNVCIATRKDDTALKDSIQSAMDSLGWNDKAKMDELMTTVLTQQPAAN